MTERRLNHFLSVHGLWNHFIILYTVELDRPHEKTASKQKINIIFLEIKTFRALTLSLYYFIILRFSDSF